MGGQVNGERVVVGSNLVAREGGRPRGGVPVVQQLPLRHVRTDPARVHVTIHLPSVLLLEKRDEQIHQFGLSRSRLTEQHDEAAPLVALLDQQAAKVRHDIPLLVLTDALGLEDGVEGGQHCILPLEVAVENWEGVSCVRRGVNGAGVNLQYKPHSQVSG